MVDALVEWAEFIHEHGVERALAKADLRAAKEAAEADRAALLAEQGDDANASEERVDLIRKRRGSVRPAVTLGARTPGVTAHSQLTGTRGPGSCRARRRGRRLAMSSSWVPCSTTLRAVEHDDEVGHADRREAVRHEHGDAPVVACRPRRGREPLEQRVLGLGVEGGGRLVEDAHERLRRA